MVQNGAARGQGLDDGIADFETELRGWRVHGCNVTKASWVLRNVGGWVTVGVAGNALVELVDDDAGIFIGGGGYLPQKIGLTPTSLVDRIGNF